MKYIYQLQSNKNDGFLVTAAFLKFWQTIFSKISPFARFKRLSLCQNQTTQLRNRITLIPYLIRKENRIITLNCKNQKDKNNSSHYVCVIVKLYGPIVLKLVYFCLIFKSFSPSVRAKLLFSIFFYIVTRKSMIELLITVNVSIDQIAH